MKRAFAECKSVEFLGKFANFRDTVEPLLRNAAQTPGADSFSSFRSFKIFRRNISVNCSNVEVGAMRCQIKLKSGMDSHNWHDTQGKNADIPEWVFLSLKLLRILLVFL